MDSKGRPNHINDALCQLHRNCWYKYTDSKNQVYANLRLTDKIGVDGELVDNPVTELPSEETVNAKLKEMQDAFDVKNTDVAKARAKSYPSVYDQLDQLYHDITAGKLDATGEWDKAIKKGNDANPK